MKVLSLTLFCGAILITLPAPASSHDSRVSDANLRGAYEGACDDRTEMARGKGESKGADAYVVTSPRAGLTAKEFTPEKTAPAWTEASSRAKPMAQGST